MDKIYIGMVRTLLPFVTRVEGKCVFEKLCPDETMLIQVPKGKIIYAYDQVASYVYHLHSGLVAGVRITRAGHQVTDLFIPNQFIGLIGFMDMYSDSVRTHLGEARAITPVTYCRIRREVMWKIMDDQQSRATIINMLCNQALSRGLLMSSPLKSDVSTRIIRVMRLLEQSVGRQVGEATIIIEDISHGDIALIANTTRSTVTRTLDKLEKAGILLVSPRKITICNNNSFLDPICNQRIKSLLQIQ